MQLSLFVFLLEESLILGETQKAKAYLQIKVPLVSKDVN